MSLFGIILFTLTVAFSVCRGNVTIVSDTSLGPGSTHGLKKIKEALKAKNQAIATNHNTRSTRKSFSLVIGLASANGPAARLLKANDVTCPSTPESLVIQRIFVNGREVVVIAGSDDRGLMYAELDSADRISWSTDPDNPLSEIKNTHESPAVPERALSIYTMHRANFESHFYDENYWRCYLDMLARNRFNTFVLIFGYENWGYFAPPYPYFFDVDQFPKIKVIGITREKQKRNLDALNRIIKMAHERALNFTLGIWDHIYRGGVQGPSNRAKKPTRGIVWGLTADKLIAYTKAALPKFLEKIPGIDAIQFRMHGESGLKRGEMKAFWTSIYRVIKENRPGIRFDARAKNFPDSLIDIGLKMGINMRICTKYWMEQMGLPFHPTHINPRNQHDRRHGYADLLRYPQKYKIHWRLWTGGTIRILLWGDPDYVKRFCQSTHLYNGDGFEINEPLATKMQDHPLDQKPFALLRPRYQYYKWEFERYWHFFQVWGRVAYNPGTSPEVWRKEFEKRFGKPAAPYVEEALHSASWILPYAVSYMYPYHHFPMTRGWIEKQRQDDLPVYAKALPSDTQQFLSVDEAAVCILEGRDSAKIWPIQSSKWFARKAKEVLALVERAEKTIGSNKSREFKSTMVDLKILAHLAEYHSSRVLAGEKWALFKHSKDLSCLDSAIRNERQACDAWEKIVKTAGDVYNHDLMMGRQSAGLSGHWRDELIKLKKGIKDLLKKRNEFRPAAALNNPSKPIHVISTNDNTPPALSFKPVKKAPAGKPLTITATASDPSGVKWVRLRYRSVTQFEDYRSLDMKPVNKKGLYSATVPGEHINPRFDFMYFFEVMDTKHNGKIYPCLWKETPYIIVKVVRQ